MTALAALAAVTVTLPTTLQPLSATPPPGGGARFEVEGTAVVHRVRATQRVDVAVGPSGRPFSVVVTQRLVVRDRGDYAYVIPAPLRDVRAARGSESQPGLRRDAIVWSGFVVDRTLLAARATLRTADAAPSLPLRISIARGRVTIENATAVQAGLPAAPADRAAIARMLASIRAAVLRGAPVIGGSTVPASAPVRIVAARAEAPLRVVGTIGRRRVDLVLGDGRPLRATYPAGRIALTVAPVPPLALLGGGAGEDGAALLQRTAGALQRLARVRQYDAFLGSPDPRGTGTTTYVYRSAAPPRPAPVVTRPAARDRTLVWIAVAAATLAAGALVWARS